MIQKSEEALSYLKRGEFDKAKALYSVLLDRDPDDPQTICGFYSASFWDHRLDLLLKTREGKDRGKLLLQFYSDYEMEIRKRSFQEELSYQITTECILEEAKDHLKLAYQWEGSNALDRDLLLDFVSCLVKMADYKMAIEVLLYGDRSPVLDYYYAESLLMLGREPEGKAKYRDAFLNDPQIFPYSVVRHPELRTLILKAQELSKNEEEMKELVPILGWRSGFFQDALPLEAKKATTLFLELQRLSDSKIRQGSQFRLEARMEQVSLAILACTDESLNREVWSLAKSLV